MTIDKYNCKTEAKWQNEDIDLLLFFYSCKSYVGRP